MTRPKYVEFVCVDCDRPSFLTSGIQLIPLDLANLTHMLVILTETLTDSSIP